MNVLHEVEAVGCMRDKANREDSFWFRPTFNMERTRPDCVKNNSHV